jgi:hypothetical protein|tara:strand:+ start:488 stop:700 length:213 start_codon:yes stop_codon:yes gene_type:complete
MSIKWVSQKDAIETLGVSESTLKRWRNNEPKILEFGRHFRLKTPTSRQLLYNLDACEKTLSRLCTTPIEA